MSNLERDLNSPSVSNLQQICEVLGINLMEILKSTEDKEYIVCKDSRSEIFLQMIKNKIRNVN
ncbi:hypothetical protein JTT01_07795 [Clostridium botulinum]|nr:hypothetical protein [Clostridium botulinum]MCS4468531.1 hypothetical protein [Clostridium botulinum]MCS4521243.1 hypothetical protein [Clostridium botulinum]